MTIAVVGSLNVDEFFHVEGIVRPGATIAAAAHKRLLGGKGANEAVAVARAGAQVDFVGNIGYDGDWTLDELRAENVGLCHTRRLENAATGRAMIQVDSHGENSIIILAGANRPENAAPLDLDYGAYSMVLFQNEIPLETTLSEMRRAHDAGAKTMWNPSPMPSKDEFLSVPWDALDWLIVNEGESQEIARHLLDADVLDIPQLQRRHGFIGSVVVTMGARGCRVLSGTEHNEYKAPKADRVVDTTGAGDCFTGYFAAALSEGRDVPSAVSLAMRAAAVSVGHPGAMGGIPRRDVVS